MSDNDLADPLFRERREAMRAELAARDRAFLSENPGRYDFFNLVYGRAGGDAAAVPWADLAPKPQIAAWIEAHPGTGMRALDVGCGLGDHAEALAGAGYQTDAFDLAEDAIEWAKRRFPETQVRYRAMNLFEAPVGWRGAFDVVNECYTIQSLPPPLHDKTARAIASFVRPGGALLVYARVRDADGPWDGPPYPLTPNEQNLFARLGFVVEHDEAFALVRPDKTIEHRFTVWRRKFHSRQE